MNLFGFGGQRAVVGGALSAMVVLGCWQIETGAGGGGAGGSGTTDTAWSGTDLQVCSVACAKLIACGVGLDLDTCKANCSDAANASLVACFRSVGPVCNSLASCAWQAACGVSPSGSATCAAAADCGVTCAGSPTTECGCSCASQASSAVAVNYYAVAICSTLHCNVECSASGDTASCQTCLDTSCATEMGKCQ